MISSKQKGQFVFPESKNTGIFLLFIFIDIQVDVGSNAIDSAGNLAFRIEGFCIGKIVHQRDKTFCSFIGVVGRAMLILIPFINILFNEHSFTHLIKVPNFFGKQCDCNF